MAYADMSRKQISAEDEIMPFTDLNEFREFLGPLAEQYNEAQLQQLRDEMRLMAEILVDHYILKRRGHRF